MSAAFRIDGQAYWGTNGMVEIYLERLGDEAERSLGPHHLWVGWLRGWREAFFMGAVVNLDDLLRDHAERRVFATLWDHATARLLADRILTESGQHWVAEVGTSLRSHLD